MNYNIMYCKSCDVLKVDQTELICDVCSQYMENIGFIETIEDAIWLGQKYKGTAIRPSMNWELGLNKEKKGEW